MATGTARRIVRVRVRVEVIVTDHSNSNSDSDSNSNSDGISRATSDWRRATCCDGPATVAHPSSRPNPKPGPCPPCPCHRCRPIPRHKHQHCHGPSPPSPGPRPYLRWPWWPWWPWPHEATSALPPRLLAELCLGSQEGASGASGASGHECAFDCDRGCGGGSGGGGGGGGSGCGGGGSRAQDEVVNLVLEAASDDGRGGGEPSTRLRGGVAAAEGRLARLLGGSALAVTLGTYCPWPEPLTPPLTT